MNANALDRREFLGAALGAGVLALAPRKASAETKTAVAIATWPHGLPAVKRTIALLADGKSALEAAEKGVNVAEDDPECMSVGLGGLPNRDGVIQLDGAVMRGSDGMIGCVAALERIKNPVSVARKVLEKTNHVLMAGPGALAFAREQGFEEQDLSTEKSRAAWEKWKKETAGAKDKPGAGTSKDHDTIGLICLDGAGELVVATSTSGLAWKLPGRVGDSPIPGAGYFADAKVGGAAATGVGEEVLRVAGSFLVVEGMRRGLEPLEAIKEALRRIKANPPRVPTSHTRDVAFIALRKDGAVAALSLGKGFRYAVGRAGEEARLLDSATLE